MRSWNKFKRNLKVSFFFFKRAATADEDQTRVMDKLQKRLRKSNDALNKIISES